MKLERSDPEHSATLLAGAEAEAHRRRAMFEGLAQIMPVVVEEETVEVEAEASPAAQKSVQRGRVGMQFVGLLNKLSHVWTC